MREQESKYETDAFTKVAIDVMFTKMYAKAGIKNFGEKAVAAMIKEYRQIYKGPTEGKPVVTNIYPDTLFYNEKRKSLEAVKLIKEKRNGILMGRTCAYVIK